MKKLGYNHLNTIPVNDTAKNVVYNKGDHYTPKIQNNNVLFSRTPLPILKIYELPKKVLTDPNFKDYTGFKFGNFTVIGIFALHKFDKWVVRCICGFYEIRRTSILKQNPTEIDRTRCSECMDLERLRHKDFFTKNGYYPWQKRKKKIVNI